MLTNVFLFSASNYNKKLCRVVLNRAMNSEKHYTHFDKNSDWTYYTNINLIDDRNEDPLVKAFNIFVDSLTTNIAIASILESIDTTGSYVITIDTDGPNDIIKNNDKKSSYVFLKSKFLQNKKLKQRLIDFYNPYDIFVKGPLQNSVDLHVWTIVLCKLRY
jgi:hypothetical protein